MHKIIIWFLVLAFSIVAQQQKDNFVVGIYGLQSPIGTKGFQNGKLNDAIQDIKLVKNDVNGAMAMRSWNRKKYPNWDFFGFFSNYMSDMYVLTSNNKGKAGIQVLTPGLYGIFVEPIMDGTNENEKGFNRHLNRTLFKKFVFRVLNEEFKIVKKKVKSDLKTVEILTNKTKRPLLGWYLDDEPLIRNHDISAIIEMGWYIKQLEEEFFRGHEILSKYINKIKLFHADRFVAFDSDDLHGYKKSGRKKDAKFYNINGMNIPFAPNQRYTVFPIDVIDVLMPDFYSPKPTFWRKIITDIKNEFNKNNRAKPKIMPVIFANFNKKYKSSYGSNYYSQTISELKKLNIDGVWIYQWHGDKKNVGAKDIWNSNDIRLNKFIESIK